MAKRLGLRKSLGVGIIILSLSLLVLSVGGCDNERGKDLGEPPNPPKNLEISYNRFA